MRSYPYVLPLNSAALVFAAVALFSGCSDKTDPGSRQSGQFVPSWASSAVFYQIFPERFANGDVTNDPVRASLEREGRFAPETWHPSTWTADWYGRADWEKQLGPDFYRSVFSRRYGGDMQGVLDHLDYLDSLGVNALYFNPVFYARSLHKYDASSYHHIDPYFGPDPSGDIELIATETSNPDTWKWTSADSLFLHLLTQAHARDIRIIIDGVWNHTGRSFFAFADLEKNQEESPYKDWYIVNKYDDPTTDENEFAYESWWNSITLPVFADTPDGSDLHPGPKAYIFDATRRWMDPNGDGDPGDGIDGWRLDVTEDVPKQFWIDWNGLVRVLNPDAYTVSEIWGDASGFVEQTGFSATMNYWAFALPVKGFFIDRAIPASEFVRLVEERKSDYTGPVQSALLNLTDSHDTARLATMIVNANPDYSDPDWFDYDRNSSARGGGSYSIRKPTARDREVQRMIALFQMTFPGAPMIYYGTEAGMWGADDPDDRMPMVWPELDFEPQSINPDGTRHEPDVVEFDHALFDYYRKVIRLRREHPTLTGDIVRFLETDDESEAVAMLRGEGSERILVVLNAGSDEYRLTVSRSDFRVDSPSILVSSGPGVTFETGDPYVVVQVPPRTAVAIGTQSAETAE